MQWHTIYSAKRRKGHPASPEDSAPGRSGYQRDYDRLIFSSPFRRLQNKTQVFPLPGSIFVHNRLTHSLEVSCVGRSLGALVGNGIYEKYKDENGEQPGFADFYRYDLANVIASACIAHDIGNPPFGHSGEDALSQYFRDNESELKDRFSEAEWADLTNFEGNANAFRLLTHQFDGRAEGGYRLTYATLVSILKYPCESLATHKKKGIHRKKYGFFQSEEDLFLDVATELGLVREEVEERLAFRRHPFVFLTEAADDICYNVIDLEDAHRLKIITYAEAEGFLLNFYPEGSAERKRTANTLLKFNDNNEKVAFLRAQVIGRLTNACQEAFLENEAAILSGTFNTSLIEAIDEEAQKALKAIETYSVAHIYNHDSVVEVELAGYSVLGYLVGKMVPAILSDKKSKADKKLLRLIPSQFYTEGAERSAYEKAQAVLDFVSGMTDLYAVDLYRRISGISMPYY
jgi:dGTPase